MVSQAAYWAAWAPFLFYFFFSQKVVKGEGKVEGGGEAEEGRLKEGGNGFGIW